MRITGDRPIHAVSGAIDSAAINMPNMNGEELVVALAADPEYAHIPVIVVSTDQSEERVTRMLAMGARGYVTKPFVPHTLGAALAGLQEAR